MALIFAVGDISIGVGWVCQKTRLRRSSFLLVNGSACSNNIYYRDYRVTNVFEQYFSFSKKVNNEKTALSLFFARRGLARARVLLTLVAYFIPRFITGREIARFIVFTAQ